jgi:hypothetical protein
LGNLRRGHFPYELSSGSIFLIEFEGVLPETSIEYRHFTGPIKGRTLRDQPGE